VSLLGPPKVLYKSTRLLKIVNYCNFLFKNITVLNLRFSIDLQFLRNLRLRLTDFIFFLRNLRLCVLNLFFSCSICTLLTN